MRLRRQEPHSHRCAQYAACIFDGLTKDRLPARRLQLEHQLGLGRRDDCSLGEFEGIAITNPEGRA